MKLDKGILVAVAMMVGSMAAVGCKSQTPKPITDEGPLAPVVLEQPAKAEPAPAQPAPAAQPESAKVAVATTPKTIVDARFQNPTLPHLGVASKAPPPLRIESRGRAPSADAFYVPGYWRYSGAQYVWMSGGWDTRRIGYRYAAPRWERTGTRYVFVPGRWTERVHYRVGPGLVKQYTPRHYRGGHFNVSATRRFHRHF
jgi:hypothetical protein